MKTRILSMFLVLCMLLPLIPVTTSVSAASQNFKDEDVTWLGTEKEY